MAYQALARKWRPRQFGEIVGQDHVVRALTHALEFDRLHHAYLFTGTRGVGKTTIARILAKAVNCEAILGAEPCGSCLSCRELDEGRFVDLVEVDAASRTKVEDTRDLLDNVLYAPTRGRYKIYLIDEVHMLSAHSFNALLKTLEEPPAHVKFLLATTDPQKIPVTVLSRCLQFNLKQLTPQQIRGHLEYVLEHESIAYEAGAVRSLARSAHGSLRDGLSLLDQGIAHGGGTLSEATVAAMLGTVARQPVLDVLDAVLSGDLKEVLRHVDEMDQHAPIYQDVLQDLLLILRHVSLAQWVPETVRHDEDAERLLAIAKMTAAEDLQLLYQIALVGHRDLAMAPDPRIGFEMILLRMLAFRPVEAQRRPVQETLAPKPQKPTPQPNRESTEPSNTAFKESELSPPPILTGDSSDSVLHHPKPQDWPRLIEALGLSALSRELASNAVLVQLDDQSCVLRLDPKHRQLQSPRSVAALEASLCAHLGRTLKLTVRLEDPLSETPAEQLRRESDERQVDAETAIEQDATIQALKATFGARLVPGSVKPIDP